jgi:hypothetical protein
MFNMFLRDNKIQGRNEVLSRLNVSWELNKRSDAGVTIVNYYALKDPNSAVCLSSELERGSFANKWHLFDMVCTQDSILNQLDKATKKRFTTIVIDKYRAQLEYSNTFGSTKTTSMLIISEIMLTEKFQPYLDALQSNTDLHVFALTGILRSGDLYDIVLKYGTQFINS